MTYRFIATVLASIACCGLLHGCNSKPCNDRVDALTNAACRKCLADKGDVYDHVFNPTGQVGNPESDAQVIASNGFSVEADPLVQALKDCGHVYH